MLREWRAEDVESLAKNGNNSKIWLMFRDIFPHPYTKECAIDFIKRAETMQNVFAIVVDNKAVGNIGYFPQNDIERFNAEIGYWIGESYWGRGIMTNVLKAITNHIFATTDMIRLFATVFETNPASMKVSLSQQVVYP
ncbi:MAG: GNAT family N-acetyltransferase [Bacteroidales bacterium]